VTERYRYFGESCFHHVLLSNLKRKVEYFPETSMLFSQNTWRHIPGCNNLHVTCSEYEYFKTHIFYDVSLYFALRFVIGLLMAQPELRSDLTSMSAVWT
jgi:hypothetical protein